ncbi:MAG: PAS domain S-box protein [Oscillatoriales cyanobacterium]|nr:MAG: PAS domain S-box protein [Oscillatoriales cyanobacterium]
MKQSLTSSRVVALGSMLLLTIAATLFDVVQTQRVRDRYRLEALQDLGAMRTSMTQILEGSVQVSTSIAVAIAAQAQLTPAEFQILATGFSQSYGDIVGIDLLENLQPTERYRRAQDLNLPSPSQIPDQPTVTPIAKPTRAIVLITDLQIALDRSQFAHNFGQFDYLLQDPQNPDTRQQPLIGQSDVFTRRPVSGDITFGDQIWQLSAVPKSGWDIVPASRFLTRTLSLMVVVGAGGLVWLILEIPRWRQIAIQKAVVDLERREQHYRSIVEKAHTIIIRLSETGTIELLNQHAQNIFGLEAQAVIGKDLATILMVPDRAYLLKESLRNSLRNGYEDCELECMRGSGESAWIAWNFRTLTDQKRQTTGVIATGLDVTQRRQREQALQASEAQLNSLIQAMNDTIFVMDRTGTYRQVATTRTSLVENPTELIGKTVMEVLGDEFGMHVQSRLQACIDHNQTLEFEYSATVNQQHLWLDATASPLGNGLAVLVVRDVSQRRSAEDELRQAKAELEARVAARAGEIHDANKNLQREVVERMQIEDALRQSEEREREKATQLESTILELKRTQAQLIQTEKMSSLGQLAAGMAHEINNPVNFIQGNIRPIRDYTNDLLELIELFHQEYPDLSEAIEDFMDEIDLDFLRQDLNKALDSMQSGTERIHSIIKSLQNFSRLDETGMKRVNLLDGLNSSLAMLRSRFKGNSKRPAIEIVSDFQALPPVMCYPSQINQAMINLIDNAIDAIEEQYSTSEPPPRDSPKITIRTQTLEDEKVCISIADNANGMPPEVLECIFNPFFTTKPVGQGTGLGLSVAYQTVHENHDGQLLCTSTIGQGTEFQIVLPIVNREKMHIQQSVETAT